MEEAVIAQFVSTLAGFAPLRDIAVFHNLSVEKESPPEVFGLQLGHNDVALGFQPVVVSQYNGSLFTVRPGDLCLHPA